MNRIASPADLKILGLEFGGERYFICYRPDQWHAAIMAAKAWRADPRLSFSSVHLDVVIDRMTAYEGLPEQQ